jgi:hypothetical protein
VRRLAAYTRIVLEPTVGTSFRWFCILALVALIGRFDHDLTLFILLVGLNFTKEVYEICSQREDLLPGVFMDHF